MTLPIIILGTGGNCIDILDTLHDLNDAGPAKRYECVGFLDDREDLWGRQIHGVPVLGPLSAAPDWPDCQFVNGIGSPINFWKKKDVIARTGVPDERFARVVHPTASVSRLAALGPGTVVFQNVTITSNVQIGKHVIILPNTVISHDDQVGDYTSFAAGVCVSGGVTIGASCYLGTNSSVIGNITIGDHCLVGMGTVVLNNLPANTVVVGNPARVIRNTRDGSGPDAAP